MTERSPVDASRETVWEAFADLARAYDGLPMRTPQQVDADVAAAEIVVNAALAAYEAAVRAEEREKRAASGLRPRWRIACSEWDEIGVTVDDHCFVVLMKFDSEWTPIPYIPRAVAEWIAGHLTEIEASR